MYVHPPRVFVSAYERGNSRLLPYQERNYGGFVHPHKLASYQHSSLPGYYPATDILPVVSNPTGEVSTGKVTGSVKPFFTVVILFSPIISKVPVVWEKERGGVMIWTLNLGGIWNASKTWCSIKIRRNKIE